jgi:hypothetical protein
MPFGLRNAGATYQRCMNHVFGEHIGRTVEAYVDDIVVKTSKASDLLSNKQSLDLRRSLRLARPQPRTDYATGDASLPYS